ncbi:MAG: outer membrane beta-barrel protein [Bdellovibrionota bacterium]
MKFYSLVLAMAVTGGILFGLQKTAHGELVFEDDLKENSNQASQPSQAAVKKDAQTEADAERAELSKSEMMRRQRMREELKNEDLLTQKLEELRLKDEMKRTEHLTNGISGVEKTQKEPVAPLDEQRIGSAAQPQTIQANPALQNTSAVGINGAPVATSSAAVVESEIEEDEEDPRQVSITPRGGLSSITGSMYDVESKYSLGAGISVDVTDYIAFTGGYTYSEYRFGAGNTLYYPVGFNNTYLQRLQFNDNVIDLGARLYVLDSRSRVRPFVGAGGAYRRGYVNYDDRTKQFLKGMNAYDGQDVNISGFAGYLETGVEFKLTKSIALSGAFRYFNIFSSTQSHPVNPNAFLGPNGYGYGYAYNAAPGYYGYNNDSRSRAGNALAGNNFFQLMGGITVSF